MQRVTRLLTAAVLVVLAAPALPQAHAADSPSGLLVFDDMPSDGQYHSRLRVVPAAGGAELTVPDRDGWELFPAWHGRDRLSFVTDFGRAAAGETTSTEIVDAALDGSDDHQLTDDNGPGGAAFDHRSMAWSPDGKLLAFTRDVGNGAPIYLIDADGTNERELSPQGESVSGLTWAPDGQSIVYSNGQELLRIGLDGAASRLGVEGHSPQLSADGTKLTYAGTARGPSDLWHIYVADADGSNAHEEVAEGASPTLSPDGEWLAYWTRQAVLVRRLSDGHTTTVAAVAAHSSSFGLRWQPPAPATGGSGGSGTTSAATRKRTTPTSKSAAAPVTTAASDTTVTTTAAESTTTTAASQGTDDSAVAAGPSKGKADGKHASSNRPLTALLVLLLLAAAGGGAFAALRMRRGRAPGAPPAAPDPGP